MKVTDLNVVNAIAAEILGNEGGEILEFLNIDDAAMCLTMIYMTNDTTAGMTQDYVNNISVLSSTTRIGIIGFGHHSFYKSEAALCKYETLMEDLRHINTVMDAALARWEVRDV